MVDLGLGEYITQIPSTRYPIYTRGNAGEVWPEVAYPLTITLTRKAGEIASAQAAINAGVITLKDIKDGPTCFGGVFAGYMYLNLSFGVITPAFIAACAEAISPALRVNVIVNG